MWADFLILPVISAELRNTPAACMLFWFFISSSVFQFMLFRMLSQKNSIARLFRKVYLPDLLFTPGHEIPAPQRPWAGTAEAAKDGPGSAPYFIALPPHIDSTSHKKLWEVERRMQRMFGRINPRKRF
jgi:hypothetical protein